MFKYLCLWNRIIINSRTPTESNSQCNSSAKLNPKPHPVFHFPQTIRSDGTSQKVFFKYKIFYGSNFTPEQVCPWFPFWTVSPIIFCTSEIKLFWICVEFHHQISWSISSQKELISKKKTIIAFVSCDEMLIASQQLVQYFWNGSLGWRSISTIIQTWYCVKGVKWDKIFELITVLVPWNIQF